VGVVHWHDVGIPQLLGTAELLQVRRLMLSRCAAHIYRQLHSMTSMWSTTLLLLTLLSESQVSISLVIHGL